MNINGFEVLVKNQYNLPTGVRYSTCPLCSENRKKSKEKCLMLDWKTGIGTCQHCGEIIQLHKFKKKEKEKEYVMPTWQNNTELSEGVVKWFEGRKISQFTLRRLKVTEGSEWMPQVQKSRNTIQFNYFRDGELVNIKYRDGKKNFKLVKDAEKILYNIDNWKTSNEVYFFEGEMDALSAIECGYTNSTSTPNGSTKGNVNLEYIDSCIDELDNKDRIVLVLDDDEAGQNVQKELIRRLGAERCYTVNMHGFKDINEALCDGGKEKVKEILDNAVQCPLENIVTLKDVRSQLHSFYINGMEKGYDIGLKSFDDNFTTYLSQYIVVTGIPSSGKSDFVEMMITGYNKLHGWKAAICSPESKPDIMIMDRMCRKISGMRPENQYDLDNLKWKKTEDHFSDNFFFMDYESGYELETVLKKGAELVKRKGIKVLVIDPYNKVKLRKSINKGVNEYTNDYLTEIDNFVRKYNCLIILVAHPRKPSGPEVAGYKPSFYDIKGGGEFYDMSPHGLRVSRNYDNKTVEVKVLKVKFANLGINNAETVLTYNTKNSRYCECKEEMGIITTTFDNTFWLDEPDEQTSLDNSDLIPSEIASEFNNDIEPPF